MSHIILVVLNLFSFIYAFAHILFDINRGVPFIVAIYSDVGNLISIATWLLTFFIWARSIIRTKLNDSLQGSSRIIINIMPFIIAAAALGIFIANVLLIIHFDMFRLKESDSGLFIIGLFLIIVVDIGIVWMVVFIESLSRWGNNEYEYMDEHFNYNMFFQGVIYAFIASYFMLAITHGFSWAYSSDVSFQELVIQGIILSLLMILLEPFVIVITAMSALMGG